MKTILTLLKFYEQEQERGPRLFCCRLNQLTPSPILPNIRKVSTLHTTQREERMRERKATQREERMRERKATQREE